MKIELEFELHQRTYRASILGNTTVVTTVVRYTIQHNIIMFWRGFAMCRIHLGHHHAQLNKKLTQRSECVEPDITLYHYNQCHRR